VSDPYRTAAPGAPAPVDSVSPDALSVQYVVTACAPKGEPHRLGFATEADARRWVAAACGPVVGTRIDREIGS